MRPGLALSRTLMPPVAPVAPMAPLRPDRRLPMLDLTLIAVLAVSFALLAGYGALCDRL